VEHGRKAGVSNIEKEITSPQNPRFILHDSQGFSHGRGDNFNIVKDFIKTRSQKENLKDRLHAIWFDGLFGWFCTGLLTSFGQAVFCSARIRWNVARSCWGRDSSDEGLHRFVHAQTCSHSIKYNQSTPVPIVAVFTKYDVLVESFKPPDEEDFYGDIEKEIENLDKEVSGMDLNTGTSASEIDPHVLSLAEDKLCEMITPFEEKLGDVPWVKVSGLDILPYVLSARSNWLVLKTVKPEFSKTLDELVDVTKQRINNSLELLWAITQQQSVAPKIKASIESVHIPSILRCC
jgi:hypothetical protein